MQGNLSERSGLGGTFLGGHHPAHHIAASPSLEVVIAPFDGPLQLGMSHDQHWFGPVARSSAGDELATAFSNFQTFGQNAVHGSDRAQVPPFIQQLRPYGGRSFVDKLPAVPPFRVGSRLAEVELQPPGSRRRFSIALANPAPDHSPHECREFPRNATLCPSALVFEAAALQRDSQ